MRNYQLSDFTWVILVAIGFLLYLVGILPHSMLIDYFGTTALLCSFELTAFLLWSGTGLYEPTVDVVKTDEESKLVQSDYFKLLLGLKL
jgi:hypothetical protein